MPPRVRIILLWLCTALFLCRVLGQIIAGIYHPPQLPEWHEWYSGLLPYPWLLLSQMLILMLMAVVNTDNGRESGFFHVTQPRTRRVLIFLAGIYALGMIARYAWRMTVMPEARWFGGTIPIWFHLVLASWLVLLGARLRGKDRNMAQDRPASPS